MNRGVMVIGCGSVGLGVARALLQASALASQGRVVVIDNQGDSEGVLVRDEDGTTRVESLNTDELQLLVAARAPREFPQELVLRARDFIWEPELSYVDGKWESKEERRAHWQQSHARNNRKFQSMQAKARRR
jgi:homoserine dehydrogenase